MTANFDMSTFDNLNNSKLASILEELGKPSYAWRVLTGAENRSKVILEILFCLVRRISGRVYVHFSIQDGFVFTGIRDASELSKIEALVASLQNT